MKLTEKIFKEVLTNIKQQNDSDVARAKTLSDIYGTDIDPVDNSLITKSIFILFGEIFNDDQLSDISFFCYDQDFGRKANRTVDDLWNDLIKNMEVEYIYVKPGQDDN